MRTRSLFLALLVNAALPLLRSQTPATVETPAPGAATTATASTDARPAVTLTHEAPAGVSKNKDTLSVDFPDEEIRAILRNVADLFELNLVIPETLQGKTSIKLRDVTWRQIFTVTLSPVGYTFVEEGNIIKIVTADSLNLEPVTTDVFVVNYAKAEDIKKSVEPLVEAAAGGRVIVDTRSNALVISERPTRLTRIRAIVERLDKATDQVMIESKFIEVTDRDIKNLGVKWNSLAAYGINAGPFNSSFSRNRDGSYSNGNNGNASGDSTNNTSSAGTTNSNTSSTVTSSPSGVTGSSVTASNSTLNSTSASTSSLASAFDAIQSLASSGSTGRLTTAVFDADAISVVLSALQTMDDIRIVSNPTVVTLNNTESTINVGEEFPIPNYTYNQERGTFEVSGFQYRPIGVLLKVTPQVNSQGFIKLNVEPEVSQRNGETSFGGASGASIPIIATRKAKTQVSLKDGFTMGIGGLMSSRSENGSSKVPVLGDIPVLGRAFKSKTKDYSHTNLLIFITAKTVAADGAPIGEVFDPRSMRAMKVQKDEMPGYRDGSDPFYTEPVAPPAAKKSWWRRSDKKDETK